MSSFAAESCFTTDAGTLTASWLVKRLLRTVPKIARPIVLPMMRKNCRLAETSPRRWMGYWFCTMEVNALIATPSPRPITAVSRPSVRHDAFMVMRLMRYAPTATATKPQTTSTL